MQGREIYPYNIAQYLTTEQNAQTFCRAGLTVGSAVYRKVTPHINTVGIYIYMGS